MCGIVGSVNLINNKSSSFEKEHRAWLKKSDELLFHRGPDSGGEFLDKNLVFGVRRLRIHDLSEITDQPFKILDGKIVLLFNGAIFNFKELREELKIKGHKFKTTGDTEVLAYGYLQWGEEVFSKLDGMFAVAIYDKRKNQIFIARDRVGIKPLYLHKSKNFLAFSSEIKPLLAHPKIKKEINKKVIPEFLAFQFISPPETFFKNIVSLRPGRYLKINLSTKSIITEKTYWQIDGKILIDKKGYKFEHTFNKALKYCWDSDRETGVQLSGGVDSSLICLLTKKYLSKSNYSTFSVLFDDTKSKYYFPRSEKKFINQIVKKCKIKNYNWTFYEKNLKPALVEAIWHNEHPLYGASSVLYMLLAKQIQKKATVLLTGEGADDIFLGYFNDWNFTSNYKNLYRYFIEPENLIMLLGKDGFDQSISKRLDLAQDKRFNGFSNRQKASAVTIETVLHGLLMRHDRMFMSNSIEGRLPFCTNDIIDSRFLMNDSEIHDGKNGKLFMKNILSDLTNKDFAFRKKIGFSAPFGDWCSNEDIWHQYVKNLNEDFLSDFINIDFIKKHKKMSENKAKWSNQNLNMIFSLTQFQLWYEIFFNNSNFLEKTSLEKFSK